MEEPEWSRSISHGRPGGPARQALMHADKLGHEIKRRMEEMVGIHPDKMPPELRVHVYSIWGIGASFGRKAASSFSPNVRGF